MLILFFQKVQTNKGDNYKVLIVGSIFNFTFKLINNLEEFVRSSYRSTKDSITI